MSLDALEVLFEETRRKVPIYLQDKCHGHDIEHGLYADGLGLV